MKLKVLEESKEKLKLEVAGETHTLLNTIRKELWNDEHIKVAGYNIAHPLTAQPILIVETDGKETARKALKDAVKRLDKYSSDLQAKFKKVL